MPDILSKFTTHYQRILAIAHRVAAESGRPQVTAVDLFYALTLEQGSLANDFLNKQTLTPVTVRQRLYNSVTDNVVTRPPLAPAPYEPVNWMIILTDYLTVTAKRVVEKSIATAWRFNHHYIGSEHLLYAFTISDDLTISDLWKKLDITPTVLKLQVVSALKSASRFPDLAQLLLDNEEKTDDQAGAETPALDFFCTDLTAGEIQRKVDPVIGRHGEIDRLINILARRTKNNPLLLGDPGVGKTAIVEGLAKRIMDGQVPEFLMDKKIYALDLGLIIAGTMYRGEFENRLKQILDELKVHEEIIIFIDEIHTIIGAGAAPGSLDLANLIKPALAKGLIRCIGATTPEDYKKSIESDAALERRFQVVKVAEPTPAETISVLNGLRHNYELFHGVKISNEAIEAAVELSERYLPEKFLPDKAIDLLDEAASKLKVTQPTDNKLITRRELETKLKELNQAKENAIKQEYFSQAISYKTEAGKVALGLDQLAGQFDPRPANPKLTVTRQQVAEIVAQITGVPLTELVAKERLQLNKLEALIGQYIVGQSEAIQAITQAIRRARLGLGNPLRPIGSFIFLGPSGVGKTELAKVIAEQVFKNRHALIRLDMSEFSEAFNISKLIGAPAGYVGYKDSNKLTDLIKRQPFSVVLFDEIEKAHPDVFNLLLQILEDGHLTDAAGKQINFKNTLIIMTSNLGLNELNQQARLGFDAGGKSTLENFQANFQQTKNQLLDEVKKFFRPEFLNRLDGVLVFNPLSESDLAKIVQLQISEFNQRLTRQKIKLTVRLAPGAARAIARLTFSPEQGARGIRRLLQSELEDNLTNQLIAGTVKLSGQVKIKVKDGKLIIQ